ncbi:hypothetical protein LMG29542_07078 [Paraburkholderia humisilvae]|uniref:Uncharacterized protein n=1 Tax=Paraburkholderia humisilvae TaxID=627669 RepID=A0A6J5F6A4_9BURK|nr:hypothetical protein LMG29542_07078 [Paraburkholderia humisilvae]
MALIAQSEPDNYLHELASGMDPLGRSSQSMLAVGKTGVNGGVSGALQARVAGSRSVGGTGDLDGEMPLPGIAPRTDQALAIGIGSGVPAYTLTPRRPGTGCFALQQAMASCH